MMTPRGFLVCVLLLVILAFAGGAFVVDGDTAGGLALLLFALVGVKLCYDLTDWNHRPY